LQISDLVSISALHCGTITFVTRYGFRQILHANQKCDGYSICLVFRKP